MECAIDIDRLSCPTVTDRFLGTGSFSALSATIQLPDRCRGRHSTGTGNIAKGALLYAEPRTPDHADAIIKRFSATIQEGNK